MSTLKQIFLSSGTLCALFLPTLIVSMSLDISNENSDMGKSTGVEDTINFLPPENRLRVCGQRLTLEINAICNVGYYTPGLPTILYPQKSSHSSHSSLNEVRTNEVRTNEVKGHRERGREPSNEIPTRVSRGVIEECCRKPCDRKTLLKYCAKNESRRDGSEIEGTGTSPTTTSTSSPTEHLVLKRTSSVLQQEEKGQITTTNSRKRFKTKDDGSDNCINCNKHKEKDEDEKDSQSLTSGGCRRSRGRKFRRLKSRRKADGQSLLLPLLLQLLWEKLGKTNNGRGAKTFFPHLSSDETTSPVHGQRPVSSGRTITARDIYQTPISFLHSRLKPSSDETVRDLEEGWSSEKIQLGSTENESTNHNKIRTHASQVTDSPHPQVFALPLGTNPDFFTL